MDDVLILNKSVLFSGTLDELTSNGAHSLEDRYLAVSGGSR